MRFLDTKPRTSNQALAENNHCWQLPYDETVPGNFRTSIQPSKFSSFCLELQEPHSTSFNDVFVGARRSISLEFEFVSWTPSCLKEWRKVRPCLNPTDTNKHPFGMANYRIAVNTHVTSHVFLPMFEDHNDVIFVTSQTLFICISSIVCSSIYSKSLFGPSQQKTSWKVLFFPWFGWAAVVIRFNVERRNQKNIKKVEKNMK